MAREKSRTAIFDLDGTLSDPLRGIYDSISWAMNQHGYATPTLQDVRSGIGPPLRESVGALGVVEGDLDRVIASYRELYGTTGLYANELIDGVGELLSSLRQRGVTLAVATSKVEPWAREVLQYFGLLDQFSVVAGATFDGVRTNKIEVLANCLERLGPKATNAVMIGDRLHDIKGAQQFGLRSVGVLWGFGELEELVTAGATRTVATTQQLDEALISLWEFAEN